MARRISKLIIDVQRDPLGTGIGKPEMLKGPLAGWSSRRINDEHRLIYRVRDNDLPRPRRQRARVGAVAERGRRRDEGAARLESRPAPTPSRDGQEPSPFTSSAGSSGSSGAFASGA
ncbi:MAG TPA: Txe/YoeB family addiction module toxin, partial [Actinoplanes sp.]|nr:Txe/YoeB family addiction module toxin [Actinoplanes sp.]